MFEGFGAFDIRTSETTINGRISGQGSPLLLLHGIPETHVMWHSTAPLLAERFTVVVTDLRGFGDSGKPASTADHSPYSMRHIARDQIEVMAKLGFEQFGVAGHDRGARCAYRMALDHPDTVSRLAVLDVIPTGDAFTRADGAFGLGFWVWFFLAAPSPVPEELIAGAPDAFVDHMLNTWSDVPDVFPPEVRAEYVAKFRDPATVHAICEEYRAAATIDWANDEADRGRKKIGCPTLVMWSQSGALGEFYEPIAIWREWADEVEGMSLPVGHFIPEEAPELTVRHLTQFFDR